MVQVQACNLSRARALHFAEHHAVAAALLPARKGSPLPMAYACEASGLLFVHVFKAGGTSVQQTLMGSCSQSESSNANEHRCVEHRCSSPQFTAFDVALMGSSLTTVCGRPWAPWCSKLGWEQLNTSRFFVFALVRDPVSRFLSAANEVARRERDAGRTRGPDVDVHALLRRIGKHGFGSVDIHLHPQLWFCSDARMQPVQFDFIGLLPEDMGNVQACIRASADGARPPQLAQQGVVHAQLHSTTHGKSGARLLSDNETRACCHAYRADFTAFALPHPAVCNSVFPWRPPSTWRPEYTLWPAWSTPLHRGEDDSLERRHHSSLLAPPPPPPL